MVPTVDSLALSRETSRHPTIPIDRSLERSRLTCFSLTMRNVETLDHTFLPEYIQDVRESKKYCPEDQKHCKASILWYGIQRTSELSIRTPRMANPSHITKWV